MCGASISCASCLWRISLSSLIMNNEQICIIHVNMYFLHAILIYYYLRWSFPKTYKLKWMTINVCTCITGIQRETLNIPPELTETEMLVKCTRCIPLSGYLRRLQISIHRWIRIIWWNWLCWIITSDSSDLLEIWSRNITQRVVKAVTHEEADIIIIRQIIQADTKSVLVITVFDRCTCIAAPLFSQQRRQKSSDVVSLKTTTLCLA